MNPLLISKELFRNILNNRQNDGHYLESDFKDDILRRIRAVRFYNNFVLVREEASQSGRPVDKRGQGSEIASSETTSIDLCKAR